MMKTVCLWVLIRIAHLLPEPQEGEGWPTQNRQPCGKHNPIRGETLGREADGRVSRRKQLVGARRWSLIGACGSRNEWAVFSVCISLTRDRVVVVRQVILQFGLRHSTRHLIPGKRIYAMPPTALQPVLHDVLRLQGGQTSDALEHILEDHRRSYRLGSTIIAYPIRHLARRRVAAEQMPSGRWAARVLPAQP